MTYDDLIAQIADRTAETKASVRKVLQACAAVKATALQNGEDVRIPGEGRFFVKRNEGRMARNPRTGEPVSVPASNAVKFKPARELTDLVNRR